MIGIITGSGFYDFPNVQDAKEQSVKTPFGTAQVTLSMLENKTIAFIARHGKNHALLPNHINYRANLTALKYLGVNSIISTTVCGILKPDLLLVKPIIFDDVYFPDNRLPDGGLCTIFTEQGAKERGHYLFDTPFSKKMHEELCAQNPDAISKATYAHVNGPRFNTKAEIKALQQHADAVSQTCGSEVVLAGELEMCIALLGFGVDYANGVKDSPTPVEELQCNLEQSKKTFTNIITKFVKAYPPGNFEGFVYRFG